MVPSPRTEDRDRLNRIADDERQSRVSGQHTGVNLVADYGERHVTGTAIRSNDLGLKAKHVEDDRLDVTDVVGPPSRRPPQRVRLGGVRDSRIASRGPDIPQ